MGRTNYELRITFYLDQADTRPHVIMFGELEQHMAVVCHQIGAVFINRSFEVFESGVRQVDYILQFADYDHFLSNIEEISRTKFNTQFTTELEAELSQD